MSEKQFKATKSGLVRGPGGFTIDADHPLLAEAIAAMLNEDWAECKKLSKRIGLFQGEVIEVLRRRDPRNPFAKLRSQIKALKRK